MASETTDLPLELDPIPGERIDPPPKERPNVVDTLEEKAEVVGLGYTVFTRFSGSRASLLAAGTTYYLFLSLFAIVAFAYGVIAAVGADEISRTLTEALDEAFPGLLGDEGLDPDELRSAGVTAGFIGLLTLLYSGSGAMVAARRSLHQVYGAPPDPRNFVVARLRLLGWLAILGPLVVVSFAASSVVGTLLDRILEAIGLEATDPQRLLAEIGGLTLSFAIDVLVIALLLSHLGGIRPSRRSRLIGSLVGSVLIQVIKFLSATIIASSLDNPQYGAFAAPIALLLMLYLLTLSTYGAACVTAGYASHHGDPSAPTAE